MKLKFIILPFFAILYLPMAFAQNANDLIITELMINPKPSHGLPEKEYIEIYNRTDKPIALNNLILQIGTTSHILPNLSLNPKEYGIICEKTDEKTFAVYGKVIPINTIVLSNTGASIKLKDTKNNTIFSVVYSDKWYTAGYSSEIIDLNYPCVEMDNWTSSIAAKGGTPAKDNSVKANKPDTQAPNILRYEVNNPNSITLIFSEKLDTTSALNKNNYSIDKGMLISKINTVIEENSQIVLTLGATMQEKTNYTLSLKNIQDCSKNIMADSQISFGNVSPADSGDVIINELLFNPKTGGNDFVELYNKSTKIIALKGWALANIDNTDKVASVKTISNFVIPPQGFLLLSKSLQNLQFYYPNTNSTNFLEMLTLPAYPDDAGTVILLNDKKQIYDRLDYSDRWHSPLLNDKSGVSLERIHANLPTNESSNWQSAATEVNFATPGYANSQQLQLLKDNGEGFAILPEIFTPDSDGQDDFCELTYNFSTTDNYATISVYDINGLKIKQITENQLMGTKGSITWNGINNVGQIQPIGYYIILAEVFNTRGESKTYKLKVVLGAKL